MLTAREQSILNLIVADYIGSAEPIASETIARKHVLGVSPATIRNDVAELENEGFITRPHVSAGSVPLEKGYRVYVETIRSKRPEGLPPPARDTILGKLREVERDVDEWTRVAAAVLAELVGSMAIATFAKSRESRIKHVELLGLQDLLAMLIVVFEQASLRRQLIRLKEPASPEDLQASANKLSQQLTGLTRREIEAAGMELTPLEEDVVDTTVVMLDLEDRTEYPDHYLVGLPNILAQPEFAEKEMVQSLVECVEDGSLAEAVLDETPNGGAVRVTIGQENQGRVLWPMSVVIVPYGIPGEAVGAVGALGPLRMEYDRAIAGVELMAGVMSGLVESVSS